MKLFITFSLFRDCRWHPQSCTLHNNNRPNFITPTEWRFFIESPAFQKCIALSKLSFAAALCCGKLHLSFKHLNRCFLSFVFESICKYRSFSYFSPLGSTVIAIVWVFSAGRPDRDWFALETLGVIWWLSVNANLQSCTYLQVGICARRVITLHRCPFEAGESNVQELRPGRFIDRLIALKGNRPNGSSCLLTETSAYTV